MAWRKSPPALISAFDAALPTDVRVERRKMFGYPAAFVNGNLFCGLHQEDVIVRLSEPQRKALEKAGGRKWAPRPGRVMREYLLLPSSAGDDEQCLSNWLEKSFAFAAALPPKAAKARTKQAAPSRAAKKVSKRRKSSDGTHG